jgi:hypothetical protein
VIRHRVLTGFGVFPDEPQRLIGRRQQRSLPTRRMEAQQGHTNTIDLYNPLESLSPSSIYEGSDLLPGDGLSTAAMSRRRCAHGSGGECPASRGSRGGGPCVTCSPAGHRRGEMRSSTAAGTARTTRRAPVGLWLRPPHRLEPLRCPPHSCGTPVRRRRGFPSDFPPPDARPHRTERNGRGRRGTAEAAASLFVHVTSDDRDRVGMGGDPRADGGATLLIASLLAPVSRHYAVGTATSAGGDHSHEDQRVATNWTRDGRSRARLVHHRLLPPADTLGRESPTLACGCTPARFKC